MTCCPSSTFISSIRPGTFDEALYVVHSTVPWMYRGVALRKYQLMKMTPSTTAAAIRMIVTMVLFFMRLSIFTLCRNEWDGRRYGAGS